MREIGQKIMRETTCVAISLPLICMSLIKVACSGYIVGGIIGLLFLIAVGIILYVRWKRRPKSTDSTTHYGRVVLPAPPNNQV